MNHTERIAETTRRHRHLSRRMAKEAIETYLALLAEEIAEGESVDIYGIGKIKIEVEAGSGAKKLSQHQRIRTRLRLARSFKLRCYNRLLD